MKKSIEFMRLLKPDIKSFRKIERLFKLDFIISIDLTFCF